MNFRSRLLNFRFMVLFLFVFVTSLIFRISFLELIEFKVDEAINLYLASRPFFGYAFPPGATASSIGVLNPPFILYLLYPILPFSRNPVVISGIIGVMNSIAIASFFIIVKKYYGALTGFVSATLLAFSPWHILFSRKIWAQDFLFPFLILQFLSIHKIIKEKKSIYWTLFTFTSLCLLQLHQATVFYIALLSLFILKYLNKKALIYAVCGLVIGLIPLIPYATYQLENNCPDCNAFIVLSQKTQHESFLSFLESPIQLMGISGMYKLFGDDYLTFSESFPLAYHLRYVFLIYILLIPFGMYVFLKKTNHLRFIVFLVPLLPLIYFLFDVDNQIHYYIPLFPFLALFSGYGLVTIGNNKNIYIGYIGRLVYLLLILSSIYFITCFFLFLSGKEELKGEYGTTYKKLNSLTEEKFKEFLTDSHYDEMVLLDRIPFQFAYSHVPFSRMLYKPSISPQKEAELTNRLSEVSIDPISRNQLIAVYSKEPITKETVRMLRAEMIKNRSLDSVFYPVYELYLAKSLQKSIEVSSGNFILEYPRHWNVSKDKTSVSLLTEDFTIMVRETTDEQISSQPAENGITDNTTKDIKNCSGDLRWCGLQSTIRTEGKIFSISLYPKRKFQNDDQKIKNITAEFKRLLLSFEKSN